VSDSAVWEAQLVECEAVLALEPGSGGSVSCGRVARALVEKGRALVALGRSEDAVVCFGVVLERFGGATDAGLREWVASALYASATQCLRLGRAGEAEARCDELIARERPTAPGVAKSEWVAKGLLVKGMSLHAQGRAQEAMSLLDELVERFGEASHADVRATVAKALNTKANILGGLDRREQALNARQELIVRFGDSTQAELRESVALAWFNNAVILRALGRTEEALVMLQELVDRFEDVRPATKPFLAADALFLKGVYLANQARR